MTHTEGKAQGLVSMRPFPYPFRAALAICSDIDGCDRQMFVKLHRFLNGESPGLGLPVSDSFFGIGGEPGQMAYFLPDGSGPSKDSDFIIEAVRDGLIDSLHSWGDFNDGGPNPVLLRKTAEYLKDLFVSNGLKLRVWINHGSPANRQNLWARLQPSYEGDDPSSPFYTSDIIREMGIRFYWWSEVLPWALSCETWSHGPATWGRLGKNALKNIIKALAGRRRQVRPASQLLELAQPVLLRDGGRLMGFTRYNASPGGVWALPTRHTLRYCLSERALNALIGSGGYMVVYTHLGLPRSFSGKLFPDPDEAALFRLSEQYNSGNIWVAPTGALLTYWLTTRCLRWKVFQEGRKTVIDLISLNDPLTGDRPPEKDELSGLCFYTPRPKETIIRIGKRELDVEIYPPDHSGRASVGLSRALSPGTELLEE